MKSTIPIARLYLKGLRFASFSFLTNTIHDESGV